MPRGCPVNLYFRVRSYKDDRDPVYVDVRDGDGDGFADHQGEGTGKAPAGPPTPTADQLYRTGRLRKRLSEAAVLLRPNADGTGVEPYPNPTAAPALLRDYGRELEDRADELRELGPALLALIGAGASSAPPPIKGAPEEARDAPLRLPGSQGDAPILAAASAILAAVRENEGNAETPAFLGRTLPLIQAGELAAFGVTAEAVASDLADALAQRAGAPAVAFTRSLAGRVRRARLAVRAKPPARSSAKITPAGGSRGVSP